MIHAEIIVIVVERRRITFKLPRKLGSACMMARNIRKAIISLLRFSKEIFFTIVLNNAMFLFFWTLYTLFLLYFRPFNEYFFLFTLI